MPSILLFHCECYKTCSIGRCFTSQIQGKCLTFQRWLFAVQAIVLLWATAKALVAPHKHKHNQSTECSGISKDETLQAKVKIQMIDFRFQPTLFVWYKLLPFLRGLQSKFEIQRRQKDSHNCCNCQNSKIILISHNCGDNFKNMRVNLIEVLLCWICGSKVYQTTIEHGQYFFLENFCNNISFPPI